MCVLYVEQQTNLLAVYGASQPSDEESQLYLSAAQYVTFWTWHSAENNPIIKTT